MEEVASVESFHTDGADSMAEPETESVTLDEEQSQISTEQSMSAERGESGDEAKDISEGSVELDENSQTASSGPPADEVTEGKTPPNERRDSIEAAVCEVVGEAQNSTDFEEVDAEVAAHAESPDEADMLGESDMTLPTAEEAGEEEKTPEEKTGEAMEVDDEGEDENAEESREEPETSLADVEMASLSNSPDKEVNRSIENETEYENDNENETETEADIEQLDESETANAEESSFKVSDDSSGKDVVDATPDEQSTTDQKDTEDADADPDADVGGDAEEDADGDGDEDSDKDKNKDKVSTELEENNDEEGEHEDEPVENVQEPEESDVCLLPDDTETQMTEEEKEQAILARENAEKEDGETQTQAKEEDEEKTKETDRETTEGPDSDDVNETTQSLEPTESADAQDADEPLLEEMPSSTTGEAGVTTKTIIGWIVPAEHKCKHCEKIKLCGFRFKNPDNISEFAYICTQACCEAISTSNPGKYFIRRKKFLVEEISAESGRKAYADADATEASTNENDTPSEKSLDGATKEDASAKTYNCLQCKETKACKYFFKQDDESYYICNDSCYTALNEEQPDKFKLKRHSIRVRNIGATTISANSAPKTPSSAESRVIARTATEAEAARLERVASFTRRCAECFVEVTLGEKNLLWETMDFCNEICLGKYQRTMGSNCQTCRGDVPHQALGKYCVRFGFDIRQFCCAACLNEYKKGLKTCSCCQKDISSGQEGFLAPVGDKEQFKDFCSQACMRRYDCMCNPKKKLRNDTCAVCNNEKPVRVEIVLDGKEHNFCSNPCFSAFKFVSNIIADQCAMCSKYFERKGAESYTIYTERRAKVYCSRICLNVYIIVNRRIVSCQWCKVKKYNFDMIYKQQDAQEVLMCSLNCLTLYGVSINAFSRTVAKCDNCNTSATPQYHLTMSDASMRNFCTYQCVMQFQSQFARAPLTLDNEPHSSNSHQQQSGGGPLNKSGPFPTGLPKRVKLKPAQQAIKMPPKNTVGNKGKGTLPVISTVSSLASGETETMIGSVTVRRSRVRARKMDSPPPLVPVTPTPMPVPPPPTTGTGQRGRPRKHPLPDGRTPSPAVNLTPSAAAASKRNATLPVRPTDEKISVQTETKIVTVPPYPPAVRNVQTSCKPQNVTVGIQAEASTISRGIQTTKDYSNKVLIPVPVPIYIPQPMYMYSAPFPVPVPIPLPIPVPIFIPTTRNSSQGILKEIKKIQDKMPADPFEAELLMMAEMVAEEKRGSDSDSDEEIKPDPGEVALQPYTNSVQPVDVTNNSYGEDVLQMALKMATGEYDQPTVDLESAMTANTITNPPPGLVTHDDSLSHMNAHHLQQQQQQQQQQQMMDVQRAGRGRKRGAVVSPVAPRNSRSPVKRQRMSDLEQSPQPSGMAMQPMEKPDANMCLKYTFGVNAWKQWVMTKNSDIEKSSVRRRQFKTELLQMTADELNYSLCLFVKEVRKPNGTEYAPDTIYYLVLGIQQYLYENGRIDNIFTDPYYERFTECLDEVARKFSVLYNDSQYIVTRVEEEHLWECKQLGAHSPHVLLSTLMFFNTKHFNLTTVEEHMQLSFSHIMKHWKRSAQNTKTPGTRNVLLRFYPPQAGLDANPRKKKVYEQQENEENPLRCPVRLYEFYLSKCPESVKTRNDVFYLQPERSCVPDSPVWYSTQALSQEALQKMLHRVKMVKEINIALLTS